MKSFSSWLRSIGVLKRIGKKFTNKKDNRVTLNKRLENLSMMSEKNIETQNYRVTSISDYQHNIIMNKQTVSIFLNTSEVV